MSQLKKINGETVTEEAWLEWRSRLLTASKVAEIIGKKGIKAEAFQTACREIVCGMEGLRDESFSNYAMERGLFLESVFAEKFLTPDWSHGECFNYGIVGCSLDFWNEKTNEIIELKCPLPKNFLKYIETPDESHALQVQFQMFIMNINHPFPTAKLVYYCPEFGQVSHKIELTIEVKALFNQLWEDVKAKISQYKEKIKELQETNL
jgi:hypothetical protein